ncbi:MAG TPA: tetratricopeptide repeat protein [Clostridia bacterium]|nr:tetratricopeptide repeat protein [Clostridia bacterium]
MSKLMRYFVGLGGLVAVFIGLSGPVFGAETETAAPVVTESAEDKTSHELLRSYLQLQEQLHATQLAIERNRKVTEESAAETAQVLTERLHSIEQALNAQQKREVEALQSSNRVMLLVGGGLAAVGFLAMALMVYFQWRAMDRLAQVTNYLPALRALPGQPLAALENGEARLVSTGAAEQSSTRLLGVLERLEKRIYELEHTTRPTLKEAEVTGSNSNGHAPEVGSNGERGAAALLTKGQSLLDLDEAEKALACFEEALQSEPGNTEALVKKGSALERLGKLDEAIESYNQAISADRSLTIAYLHKGGVFNRLERFTEALECYEQALRTQEKRSN